jgi:hypothetical protein
MRLNEFLLFGDNDAANGAGLKRRFMDGIKGCALKEGIALAMSVT